MRVLLVVLALFVASCAQITPQTPAQAVFSLSGVYAAALTVAVEYVRLPQCGEPNAPPLCADPVVLDELRSSEELAWEKLSTATQLTRLSTAGPGMRGLALHEAKEAVAIFTNLTSTLKVK